MFDDPTIPPDDGMRPPADTLPRYNTTPNWSDPFNPPSPGDPYWDEWIAANPDYRGQGYSGPPAPPSNKSAPPPPGPRNPSLITPFGERFAPPPQAPLPTMGGSLTTIPGAPQFPTIPQFAGPTMGEAANEPGYKFTLEQGQSELQNWLAAHGTFNDSSAAKSLTDYGQNAASTQYQNVWNRQRSAYDANVQTQYLDPFNAQYQNWMSGTVGPTVGNFQTNTASTLHQNDMGWQNAWNNWLQDWNIFRDQRDSTFNKQLDVATR